MASLKENEYFYDCICEFLEVAFHSILYVRGVYPTCIFSKAIKYEIPVPFSRSDILNRYIANSIESLKQYFTKDLIERISLTILNEEDIPVEKFYFEFSSNINNQNNNNNNNNKNNSNDSNNNNNNIVESNGFSQSSPLNFYINLNKKILNNNQDNNNQNNNNSDNNNNNNNSNNKPNITQLESSFKAFLLKILMTSDSFYDPSNYNNNSGDNNNSNDSFELSGDEDDNEMLKFEDTDGITVLKQKRKKQKKDHNNDNNKNSSSNKNLKFTIHVYTKNNFNLTKHSNNNNSILNINPLETPRTNINNQTTPVWIGTSKIESEIQNSASFIIPLNSNISDGKNKIKAFTEQSISK